MKRIDDMPVVRVFDGNINFAIRLLKKKMLKSNCFRILKVRRHFPNAADRQKEKQRRAYSRRRKMAR